MAQSGEEPVPCLPHLLVLLTQPVDAAREAALFPAAVTGWKLKLTTDTAAEIQQWNQVQGQSDQEWSIIFLCMQGQVLVAAH